MIRSLQLLVAEGAFVAAWWTARMGVAILGKNHPLREYHRYSEERVKKLYRDAVKAER